MADTKTKRRKMSDIYKVIVKKDNDGELYIDLPDELMKSLDWKIGDELVWEETDVLDDEGNYLEDNNE